MNFAARQKASGLFNYCSSFKNICSCLGDNLDCVISSNLAGAVKHTQTVRASNTKVSRFTLKRMSCVCLSSLTQLTHFLLGWDTRTQGFLDVWQVAGNHTLRPPKGSDIMMNERIFPQCIVCVSMCACACVYAGTYILACRWILHVHKTFSYIMDAWSIMTDLIEHSGLEQKHECHWQCSTA